MTLQITLSGGSPWGFKMTGGKDFRLPLAIGTVKPGGKAAKCGVVEGYVIERVNGEEFSDLTHHEAQNKIKNAGFSLALTLSKPKRRESIPEQLSPVSHASPPVNTSPPKVDHKVKASAPYYKRYNDPGNWQNEGPQSQSPALYSKAQPPKATITNGEKPGLSITPEIKEMIEEEEKQRQRIPAAGGMRASEVKTWEPNAPWQPPSPTASSGQDKSKAASNIGKFFQGSSAPRYGEPTFSKPLQDVAAPLGDPAVLEVRIGSNLPVPSVHWYHNNKPARESKDKDIRFLSNGPIHTLVLGELSNEVLGTYTCTIINKNGSKSCRCTVSLEGSAQSKPQNRYVPPASLQSSGGNDSRRVVASSSIGLYSNRNAQESYRGRMNRKDSRDENEESEVMKALREAEPQRHHHKTPSMKYLEESLLPESEDL